MNNKRLYYAMTNNYFKTGARDKKECTGIGNINVERARVREVAGCPREGRSARLSKEGTYKDEIHSLC